MKNIRPCPYCGGEVEMVKLNKKHPQDDDSFRIECKKCHALVVRGRGFQGELKTEALERIKQYEAEIARILNPEGNKIYKQKI